MLQNQFINYHFVIEQKSEGRIKQKDQQLQWQCAHDLHWRAMRLGAPNIWVCVVYTRICVNLSFNHFLQNLHSPGLFDIKITNWIEFLCYTSFSGDLKLRYQIIFDRIDKIHIIFCDPCFIRCRWYFFKTLTIPHFPSWFDSICVVVAPMMNCRYFQ